MIDRLRRRLTYANVMATLAMFVALGGGAYAVATIGARDIKKNAVRSKHIKRANVKRSDLRANAVNSAKVADGSLKLADVADVSRTKILSYGSVNANSCAFIDNAAFPGISDADELLVLPGAYDAGWNDVFTLDGWSSAGTGISVRVCNNSGINFANVNLPFRVLLFR